MQDRIDFSRADGNYPAADTKVQIDRSMDVGEGGQSAPITFIRALDTTWKCLDKQLVAASL